MEGRFTSYVRRMTIEVDGDAEEAGTRTWTREGDGADALGTGARERTRGWVRDARGRETRRGRGDDSIGGERDAREV